jgi:hypothetical protein
MIQVGQKVRFDPFIYIAGDGIEGFRKEVIGTVVSVYHNHKWFSVQYGNLRTSFKFCDIGEKVHICK